MMPYDVIEARPMGVHFGQLRYELALLLLEVGQPQNAALQLEKALVEDPGNDDARDLLDDLWAPTTTTASTPTTVPTTTTSD